jgi:hypothetical protein
MTALDSLTDLEADSTGKLHHSCGVIDLVRDGGLLWTLTSTEPAVEASESGVIFHRRHLKPSSRSAWAPSVCLS